jgi:hypothetical protein
MDKTPAELLKRFKAIYQNDPPDQGEVGHRPAAYILAAFAQHRSDEVLKSAARELVSDEVGPPFEHAFSKTGIGRDEVAEICRSTKVDELLAYGFAMAWGNQWDASSYKAFVESLEDLEGLRVKLKDLKKPSAPLPPGQSRRQAAFEELSGKQGIKGLGISYFTKLLFFFLPNLEKGYVLDSWTVRAVSKLADFDTWPFEKRPNGGPDWPRPKKHPEKPETYREYVANPANWKTAQHYETYCCYVEGLAEEMTKYTGKSWTASQAEQALFGSSAPDTAGKQWRDQIRPAKKLTPKNEGRGDR